MYSIQKLRLLSLSTSLSTSLDFSVEFRFLEQIEKASICLASLAVSSAHTTKIFIGSTQNATEEEK